MGIGTLDKYEFELAKDDRKIERFRIWVGLIKWTLSAGAILFALHIIFQGIKPFIGQNPKLVTALAGLIEKLNFGNMTGYLLGAGAGAAWYWERCGKRRAIREKGRLQKIVEQNDPYRPSSGLTSTGGTPKEDQ